MNEVMPLDALTIEGRSKYIYSLHQKSIDALVEHECPRCRGRIVIIPPPSRGVIEEIIFRFKSWIKGGIE